MKKNSSTGWIIGAVVVVLIIIGVAHMSSKSSTNSSGNLYVGVSDASADISNVSNVNMSVKKVELHSQARGWTTVSSESKAYPLLTLKSSGSTDLYAKESVPAGSYDRVRVTLGDTVVNTKSKGDIKAAMPSSEVVMNTSLNVASGKDSSIKLDFMADKSLHATSDGQYVFAPVVNGESRSDATIAVNSDNTETISGGNIDSNSSVGVDLDGSSKANFELSTDSSLKVNSSLGSTLKFMLGGKSYTSDSAKEQDTVSSDASGTSDMNANGSSSTDTSASGSNKNGSLNTNLNGATNSTVNLTH